MSYSRSYSETVSKSYSRTVTIHYPASKSGGSSTETVSGTVEIPIDINIHVDTDNFDDRVEGCRESIIGLNAAVIATTAKEIEAKRRNSQKIGQTIVNGFFSYIRSELSQQTQELMARSESLLAALVEQKKDCNNKSVQMQNDYESISSRYEKLFRDLDHELSTRIKAIDKPIFNLNKDLLTCSSRAADMSQLGIATIAAAETSQLDAILVASSIKQRARQLVNQTNGYLKGVYSLINTLGYMLTDSDYQGDYSLPVIYMESSEEDLSIKRNTYGSSSLPLEGIDNLDIDLLTRFQEPTLEWCEIDIAQEEQIESYFNNEFESAPLDSRIVKMMMSLKSDKKLSVIK